jgi:hypothetical protein
MERRAPQTVTGIGSSQAARRLPPRVTQHAIDRYIDRVEPCVTRHQAADAISRIVGCGQVRSTPRHWMRGQVRYTPGLRFIYQSEQPDVCALVLNGAVVTIITRRLCRRPWLPTSPGEVVEPVFAATRIPGTVELEEAA